MEDALKPLKSFQHVLNKSPAVYLIQIDFQKTVKDPYGGDDKICHQFQDSQEGEDLYHVKEGLE